MLRKFLQSSSCTPALRQSILKAIQDNGRLPNSMNPQMGGHSPLPQRMAPPPTAPPVMLPGDSTMSVLSNLWKRASLPGAPPRIPQAVSSSGELHPSGHPSVGLTHSSFPMAPGLEHSPQFDSRTGVTNPRDLVESSAHGMRPRASRPKFPPGYEFTGQVESPSMNVEMQQGANPMFNAMSYRMHGMSPDLMNSAASQMELRGGMAGVNNVDPRLHGAAADSAIQMMDPVQGLTNGDVNPGDMNFGTNDSRSIPDRPMPPMTHYSRNPPRPFGK